MTTRDDVAAQKNGDTQRGRWFAAALVWHGVIWVALSLFVAGWALQFIGHAFEGKPPEFLSDWRFLLVGSRWWLAKVSGKLGALEAETKRPPE